MPIYEFTDILKYFTKLRFEIMKIKNINNELSDETDNSDMDTSAAATGEGSGNTQWIMKKKQKQKGGSLTHEENEELKNIRYNIQIYSNI